MSIRCQNWVYEYSDATGNDRLVLLAIADEADDDGTNAFPGVDRIAHKARLPKRTTMRCLDRLQALGVLIIHRPERQGRGYFNTYEVVMKGDTVTPIAPPIKRVHKGREKARNGAPAYVNGSRPPDPLTHNPCPDGRATEDAPTPAIRAGVEVETQETPIDLLAAVAQAAPRSARHQLLDDPDQAAGRAALRHRLDALAAQLGPDAAVAVVAGEWPAAVASPMAHANARARAALGGHPVTVTPATHQRPPDPLDGITDAAAAIAERSRAREAEVADEPRLTPPPSWKDDLRARLYAADAEHAEVSL